MSSTQPKKQTTCSLYGCSREAWVGVRALKQQYCAIHWCLFLIDMPGGHAPLSPEEVTSLSAQVRLWKGENGASNHKDHL